MACGGAGGRRGRDSPVTATGGHGLETTGGRGRSRSRRRIEQNAGTVDTLVYGRLRKHMATSGRANLWRNTTCCRCTKEWQGQHGRMARGLGKVSGRRVMDNSCEYSHVCRIEERSKCGKMADKSSTRAARKRRSIVMEAPWHNNIWRPCELRQVKYEDAWHKISIR